MALRNDGSKASTKTLIASTTKLYTILQQKCQRTDGVFDQKLADYVFFPLSQILQKRKQHTDQLSEVTLECVNILLEYGWRTIELDLAKQLLILFTFIAGGVPGKKGPSAPEEILSVTYSGLALLLQDVGRTPGGAVSVIDAGTLPALGHSLTVILEGVTTGPSTDAQLHALQALDAIWKCVKDAEALAGFLPGTISGLTKCLVPTTAAKRTRKVLIKALHVLQDVLVTVLGDLQTRKLRAQSKSLSGAIVDSKEQKILSPSWLTATTAQIKLALSNVIHLRKNAASDVRQALNHLCLRLLDECHETLSESAPLLVETSMTLIEQPDQIGPFTRKTSLVDLATIYPDIGTHIKNVVYNWVTSLPRVMQSNDESAKIAALKQLSGAHSLLSGLNIDSSVLEDSFASALRDSVSLSLDSQSSAKHVEETAFNLDSEAALSLVTNAINLEEFRPVIFDEQSQRQILDSFKSLLTNAGTMTSQLNLAQDMLDYSRSGATGSSLLSSFWLASEVLQASSRSSQDLDEFFDTALTTSTTQYNFEQDLFAHSLIILTESDDDQDWRVKAVALEVVAHAAQRQNGDFRSELIDVLFPVTQLLGSAHPLLREHAVTCLNLLSKACGYKSASDMIIGNADYMVNAISLRLNTFDISPSAPQVLVMMIRLTGPSLLLYLDDVVGSIFAALENFHGYPALVESLFSVLGEIVSVGAKSDLLEIEPTQPISKFESRPRPSTIDDVLSILTSKARKPEFGNVMEHEDFPRKPWKSAQTLLDEANPPPPDEDEEDSHQEFDPPFEEVIVPPTKTNTLIRRITHQTQHHLTSSSPHLRSHLLNLIKTSALSLPSSSTDFLPLINDIWPVVLGRLYDTEPYVSIAASSTLSALCKSSGDFLTTRIQTEWPSLIKFARQRKQEAEREKGRRGKFSMASKVWEGVKSLLVDLVGWVGVRDGMFDDVVEVLGVDVLMGEEWVREGLSGGKGNIDAVWLAIELAKDVGSVWKTPKMDGFVFAEMPQRGVMV